MKKNNYAGSTQNSPSNRKITSRQSVVRDDSTKKIERVQFYPLYIPSNINIDDLLSRYPTSIPNARDKLLYLLHLIHEASTFKDENEMRSDNGFTILHSPYLQSLIDEYAELFNWLSKQGILEVDSGYICNEKSKGYRFSLKYRTEIKEVYISTWTLIRRITTNKKLSKKHVALFPKHLFNITSSELKNAHLGYSKIAESRLSYLSKWFNEKLTINRKIALDYLKEQLNEHLNSASGKFPMHKYNCAKMIVESITNQIPRFKVDHTTGRLHTFLTCLNSPLRALLEYEGNPLFAIDIKNSQPLLSLVLLDEKLFVKNRMTERMEIYNNDKNKTELYIMLGNLIKANSTNSDTNVYRELVLSGKLYTWFGKKLQELGILDNKIDEPKLRSIAKQGLLKSLFNRNQAIGYEKIQWAFKKLFPSVYEVFQLIKRKNHKTLACILQNLEAEIVLHKACSELSIIIPDTPLFTIHDSIVSTKDNLDRIIETLSKHLFDSLEQKVGLEIENWNKDYFEKEKSKKLSNTLIENPTKENNNLVAKYGYVDYELLLAPYLNSLSQTAKELGLRRNKFMESLRTLNIISNFNLPNEEFEKEKLLLTNMFYLKPKRGNRIKLFSTKVTNEGFQFLKQLVEENPDLFPKKRIRAKRL